VGLCGRVGVVREPLREAGFRVIEGGARMMLLIAILDPPESWRPMRWVVATAPAPAGCWRDGWRPYDLTPKRLVGACVLVLTTTAAAVARQQSATIHVGGALIPRPLTFSASDLAAMPRHSVTASAHHLSGAWEGVELRELLTRAGVPAGAVGQAGRVDRACIVRGALAVTEGDQR
jgi:hypothetical protein